MGNRNLYAFIFILLVITFSCNQKNENRVDDDGLATFNEGHLAQQIAVLASDSFMGRKPFTRGEIITINYLQQQFKNAGLQPGNNNSYLQEVPMVNIATTAAPAMEVTSAKENFSLKGFDDYVIWTDKTDPFISLDKAEVVFAGYGVVAPEYNWNDYKGVDVKGKVVLVMVNDPGFNSGDSSLFKGTEMTYYGRWTYKFEEAARQGAKGCLVIHNTVAASYPFTVPQNNWNGSHLRLDNKSKNENYSDMIGWISSPAASRIFKAAGMDTSVFSKADRRGFKAMPLNVQLSTSMKVQATYNKSHNVIGIIPGTGRKDEYIIYSAHWDHLGIGKPDEKGDSIYNGALDNASGTAGLIELARAFNSMKTKPERTIIFLAVTAEEQGLWGSAYYAQHPIYPVDKTVANINMDGLNATGKTKDIIIIGKGQNDLEDYLKEASEKAGRSLAFETHPEAGYYYRSDHFNFAKVGVPALYTKKGVDVIGKEPGFGEKVEEMYRQENYHRPSDEYETSWNLEGAIEDLKLLFMVGKRLAFEDTRPQWKQGSEFKAIREGKNK